MTRQGRTEIRARWKATVLKHDLGRLRINRLIVHDVPRRLAAQEDSDLRLSEVESDLDPGLRNYFRERVSDSLTRAAADVTFDHETTSPLPERITEFLDGSDSEFVPVSQQFAEHLYLSQTGVSPAGLLIVAQADLATFPAIAILKLEREAGVLARPTSVNGKVTFAIEHIRELMMTEKTRIFKVGLFWRDGAETEGLVCDNQRGTAASRDIADFFLRRFLGCQLRVQSDAITQRFYTRAQEFINSEVAHPEQKARYQIASLAEMNSGQLTIDPKRFADTHLELRDRMPFEQALRNDGLPTAAFSKDTSLITNLLRRIQIDFQSGIAVLGTTEAFETHVSMSGIEEGRTRLEVIDTISKVKGHR